MSEPTKVKESAGETHARITWSEIDGIIAERDRLRERVAELVEFIQYVADQDPNGMTREGNKARAILAKERP